MLKVLLIEDQPKLLCDILALYDYEVDYALDGFEGLQKVFSQKPAYDLIILDLDMPRMDGWSVLKIIRSTPETENMLVIILTCHDVEESIVKGLHRGADLYLVKPISPRRLLAHIQALLRRREKNSQNPERTEAMPTVTGLTSREQELLKLLVKGLSNQKIAEELVISETTVKNHLANIFRKMNVSNRTHAAYLAQKMNLF